ncbi:MAG: hypothetical protein NVS4B3_21140 [Gemmatimonadaceae bacterium]
MKDADGRHETVLPHAHRRLTASAVASVTPVFDGSIRRASIADLPVVVVLRLALLREHEANPLYRRLRDDAPARARKLVAAQLRSRDEAMFLAETNGPARQVVGLLRCIRAQSSPLLDPPHYGYLSSAYVRRPYRRRGVLRALVSAAVGWCELRGITEVRLHSVVESAAANGAWAALGFGPAELLRVRHLG